MDEAGARATLVDLADDSAPRALATIPRREVEEALRAEDGPPDLILDITRREGEGDPEYGTLSISWSREDLEGILRRAEGDSVTLAFDAEALRQALEADVEAHGLREAAAVLAVAVAAGSAAGVAAGQPAEQSSLAGYTAIEQVRSEAGGTPPASDIEAVRSVEAARASLQASIEAFRAAETGTAAEYGMPRAMPADFPATTGSDEYGMPRAMPADFPATGNADIEAVRLAAAAEQAAEASIVSGEYGVPRAMPADIAAAAGPDIEAIRAAEAAAASLQASVEAFRAAETAIPVGAEVEAVRAAESAAASLQASVQAFRAAETAVPVADIEAVRAAEIAATASVPEGIGIEAARSAAAQAARAADDGGISVTLPSPETTAAVVGGIALLITGAAFAMRGRKPVQPA
jgi:hypothetical protein